MARGRMISKSLSTSEKRAELYTAAGPLAEFCQALFPLLVVHSDDFGRQSGSAFTVKHVVDPVTPRTLGEFDTALNALHTVGLITRYVSDGKQVIEIVNFKEHQPGLKQRGGASKFDPPAAECRDLPRVAVARREMPPELNRTELNRTEGKGTEPAQAPTARAPIHDRSHRSHAHCGRVCLPAALFGEFVRRRNHLNADREIRDWALVVDNEWSEGGAHAADEPGDAFDFWKARYEERWPATPSKPKLVDSGPVYRKAGAQ